MKRKYFHTLDGLPANYHPGSQVCFANRNLFHLADSLSQIRDEQRKSAAWREKRGYKPVRQMGYKTIPAKALV